MRDNTELKNQPIPEDAWVKSSFSGTGSGSDCVEVAPLQGGRAVRDSKNPSGPKLCFTDGQWAAFVQGVQAEEPGLI